MEKLIELLNEYELEREKGIEEFKNWALPLWERYLCQGELVYEPVENFFNGESISGDSANSVVISKSYGFIKRLIDNDKIDRGKFEIEYTDKQTLKDVYIAGAKQDELIIILLAISDEPLTFLISILK